VTKSSVGSLQTSAHRHQSAVVGRQTAVSAVVGALLLIGAGLSAAARLSDDRRLLTDDCGLTSADRRLTTATLTAAPRLAAIYDSILAAQFDGAEAKLSAACPPGPVEA